MPFEQNLTALVYNAKKEIFSYLCDSHRIIIKSSMNELSDNIIL